MQYGAIQVIQRYTHMSHTLYRNHTFLTTSVIFKPIAYTPVHSFHTISASIINSTVYLISINPCQLMGEEGLIIGRHG
jgi:hypothetical protein